VRASYRLISECRGRLHPGPKTGFRLRYQPARSNGTARKNGG
jgi:hypothetical protein